MSDADHERTGISEPLARRRVAATGDGGAAGRWSSGAG